jgi:MshEN domain
MSAAKDKIGTILVREELIDEEQLARALDAQIIYGGRIGSNLVELGYVSIEDLGRALARQQGVPVARRVDLFSVSTDTVAAIPAGLCAKYKVFPLTVEDQRLELAMLDPNDLGLLDALAFQLNMRIVPRVIPELRLLRMLEKRYGIPREQRFTGIPFDGSGEHDAVGLRARAREAADFSLDIDVDDPVPGEGRAAPPTTAPPAAPPDEPDLEDSLELIYLDAVTRDLPAAPSADSPDRRRAAAKAPSADRAPSGDDLDFELDVGEPEYVSQLGDAIASLARAESRDEVLELLVRPTVSLVSVNVLLLVRGEAAVGLCASGTGVSPEAVKGLLLPLAVPSLLQQAVEQRVVVHGATADDPLQQVVARHLATKASEQVWIAPICLGSRVINLLCVHLGGGVVDEADLHQDLTQLCAAAAAAYTRLIRGQKRGGE